MQGFKKSLVALLLVVAMVLGAIVPVFAAEEPAKKQVLSDAAARLIALGVVKGDDKGNVNEDQPVTRAEAAAMIIRALKMETASDLQKGQTKFADVNADAGLQWASGVINVAVSQNIINGYPDGKFDGRGNVTYAQFAKMMIYALNYGVTVEGGVWPTAILAKADELGLTKKLSVVADAAMTRGAVMRMVDNGLTVPTLKQTGYGDVRMFDPTGETLLAKLGLDELEGRIIEIPQVAKGLAKDQVTMYVEKVNGENDEDEDNRIKSNETLDVMEGVDAQGFFGYKVIAWVNDDDEILYVQPKTKDSDILVDVVDEFKDKNKVALLIADKDYKFRDSKHKDGEAKIYINDESEDLADFFKRTKEDSCKLYGRFVKDGDEIVFAYLFDFEKSGLITKADENGFEYFDKGGNDRKIKYNDYDRVIFLDKDLKAASADDVEKNGVAYWYEDTDDDELYLVVSAANKAEGKLDRVRDDEMFISGKKYKTAKKFGNGGTTVSSNDNEDIESWMDGSNLADEVEDLTGTDVIALLDIVGRVRHVVGDSEAGSGNQYGVATDAYQTGREYMIRIMGKDGKEVAYPVEKRTDWEPYRKYFEQEFKEGKSNNTPYLPVKYKVNGSGEIKEKELLLVAGPVGPFATANWTFTPAAKPETATFKTIEFKLAADELFYGKVSEFDDDDDYIEFYKLEGSGYIKRYVENKTVIMNLALDGSDWDDPEVLEWKDIKSKNIKGDVRAVGYNIPDAKLVVFVQDFDEVKDDEQFGVTSAKPTYDGSDWWLEVDEAGEGKKEYKIDDTYKSLRKGQLLGFTVNSSNKLTPSTGKLFDRVKEDVQKAVLVTDDGDYLTLKKAQSNALETGKFKIAKDAVVYNLDKDFDLDKKLDYTDVDEGDYILYVKDESDIIRAVLIVTKCYKVGETPDPDKPVTGGTVTYITTSNIAIDNVVYTFDANSVMYNAAGTVVATGGTNIDVLLDQGDVVEDVVVDGGVVKSLKLKTDISVEAAAVEALINAFTGTGTEAQVTAARTAYDALNSYGKAIVDAAAVDNTAKLVLGEDTLAAAAFDALVAAFSTPDATQAQVTAARTAYDALSTAAKALTTPANVTALETEEAKLAAAGVIAMINDLPATITLADKADVVAARTAYNNLLAAQAAQVTNIATLTAAEAAITALEAAVADVAAAKTALTTAIFDGTDTITLPADTADVTYTVTLGTLPTFTTGSVTLGGTTPETVVVVKDAAAFTFDVTVTITATDDAGTTNADESTIKDTKVFTVTVPNTVAPITIAVK